MSNQKSIGSGNLVCIKHPHYMGDENPDLSCKVCCSKFVARIRAEQAAKFETTWSTVAQAAKPEFKPMKVSEAASQQSKRKANFDSSWI